MSNLSFDEIAKACQRAIGDEAGPRLVFPAEVSPFVPQTCSVEYSPSGEDPLTCDVLLVDAPAAVGKTTYAKSLAHRAHIPLLNLTQVPVSTHSLRGILSAELTTRGAEGLQSGKYCVIVDALDEGRIVSGEKNFEEFLVTSFQLLEEGRKTDHTAVPKLVLFGRPEAIEIARIVMELYTPELPASRLRINYFDRDEATSLVLEHVRAIKGREHVDSYAQPIGSVVNSFFDAIARAIDVSASGLWEEQHGKSFAGYAPVLGALGILIGETTNYLQLQQQLQDTGLRDAWHVLEQVAMQVLDRESGKIHDPLFERFGSDIPAETYDAAEQLDLLAALLEGRSFQVSSRLRFGRPAAGAAYRESVTAHLKEHPFLRAGQPANDVLGALVIASALAKGCNLGGGQGPALLSVYGRQPFLWRFIRRRLAADLVVEGNAVPFILGSVWSNETMTNSIASVRLDEEGGGTARLYIHTPGEENSIGVFPPIVLRQEVRNLKIDLPGGEVRVSGWPDSDSSVMKVLGDARICAGRIVFEVRGFYVGALGTPAKCHLDADDVSADQQLTVDVIGGSKLTVSGVLANRYPWDGVATTVEDEPDDPLWQMLSDCGRRLPESVSLVILPDYRLTDEARLDWARRHGELFNRLLEQLVALGLARADIVTTKPDPKMRFRPHFRWSDLLAEYESPHRQSERFGELFGRLME